MEAALKQYAEYLGNYVGITCIYREHEVLFVGIACIIKYCYLCVMVESCMIFYDCRALVGVVIIIINTVLIA